MAPRTQPTARQIRLGTELRRLREGAGLKAREVASLLNSTSAQMSQIEAGLAGVSEERVRRLAAHYACADGELIDALAAVATDRTRGWWEEFRGLLPPEFLDLSELEHHATFLHEALIVHVPGLLQTPDYARAIFGYMVPELPNSELTPRVEHRMGRKAVLQGTRPVRYEVILHECALRIRVGDRKVARDQLTYLLEAIERKQAGVRVVPFDRDWFGGASSAMLHLGGPMPQLDTVQRDSPHGSAFIDSPSQLGRFRALFSKLEQAALSHRESRDFIHRLSKEL